MKVRELMTTPAIRIHADEPVAVAARTLAHYNIGAMPVCATDGSVCGVITDRDIVTRCLAAQIPAETATVREVMTRQVLSVTPDTDVSAAAGLMRSRQVRRLPVMENGRLCGMLSLGDLAACPEKSFEAADALAEISGNLSKR